MYRIKVKTFAFSLSLSFLLGLPVLASPLQEAIDSENSQTIQTLLTQKAFDPTTQITWQKAGIVQSEPLIHWAIRQGNLDLVRSLLEKGVDPNVRDNEGNTPLILAAWGSPPPRFKPTLPSGLHQFAIHWRVRGEGYFSVLNPISGERYFTRNGSFQLDKNGQMVTEQGFMLDPAILIPSEIEGLPIKDVSINTIGEVFALNPKNQTWDVLGRITLSRFPNPSGLSAVGLGMFRATQQSGEIEDFLPGPDAPGDIEPQTSLAELQNQSAATQNNSSQQIEFLRLLIEKGANLNAINRKGENALSSSIQAGHVAAFQFLFEKAELPNDQKKAFLEKALYTSVWQSNPDLSDYLIQKGAQFPPQLALALVIDASRAGKLELLKKLQAQGIDFKALNTQLSDHLESPIMAAAAGNHTTVLKFLTEQGMDINFQYNPLASELVSNNAVFSAIESGSEEALQFLIANKARYRATHEGKEFFMQNVANYDTPVNLAARKGHLKILDTLLQSDSQINDDDLIWALKIASENAQLESIRFLMANIKQDAHVYIDSLLPEAVSSGRLDILQFLEAKGASLDSIEESMQGNLLTVVARTGNTKICEYLLQQKLDPNAQNARGWSSLHVAAFSGNPQIIKQLLVAGAKSNLIDKEGFTPLMLAIKNRYHESVKILLEADVDLKIKNQDGKTALDLARASGNQEIFTMLSHALNLPAVRLGLQDAVDANDIYLIQEIIYKGSDPNQQVYWKTGKEFFEAPLIVWAAANNQIGIIRALIENGAKINAQDNLGDSALAWATWLENVDIIETLLENNADLNLRNLNGDTALVYAIMKENIDIVKRLISKGADPKSKNNENFTLLMTAANKGNLEIIKYLISKGADPKIMTSDGKNVINQSLANGHWDASNYFLKIGINPKQTSSTGYTNLMWAAQSGNLELVKLLIAKGLDPKAKDITGWTVLMSAASSGHLNIVKHLVSLKVDHKVKDKYGKTALDYARDSDKNDVVNWLKSLK